MSAGYSNRIWTCPYFRWDKRLEVHCEGGVISMPDRASYRAFVDRCCSSERGWQSCPISIAMTEYYDRTGAEAPG